MSRPAGTPAQIIPAPGFLRDLLRYLPSALLPGLAGVLLLPLLTGQFSPAAYGNYALALAIYAWLDAATVAPFGSTVIRFYSAERPQLASTFFVVALGICALSSVFGFPALLLLYPALDNELAAALLAAILLLLAAILLELPTNVLRVQGRIGIYSLLLAIKTLGGPLAGLGLAALLGGVGWLLAGQALVTGALTPLAYVLAFGRAQPRLRGYERGLARELIGFGLPLAPAALLVLVLALSDRLIIGAFSGSDAVAIYAVSYDLASTPLWLLAGLVLRALAPLIVAAWERGGKAAAEGLQVQAVRAYLLLGMPALVGLGALGREILALLAAPGYREGAALFWPVAAGLFLYGLQLIAQRGLILARRTQAIMLAYLLAVGANIGANLLLVPVFGYAAAAWTTCAAYLLLLALIAGLAWRYVPLALPLDTLARSLSACALLYAALLLLPPNLPLEVTVGAAVYGLALLVSGEFGAMRRWRRRG